MTTKEIQVRMAKPCPEDNQAVLEFFQGLESILEYGEMPDDEADEPTPATEPEDIVKWLEEQWQAVGHRWSRVYWAGCTAIDSACDPSLDYLEYKPEIREREAEVERLKAEVKRLRAENLRWSGDAVVRQDIGLQRGWYISDGGGFLYLHRDETWHYGIQDESAFWPTEKDAAAFLKEWREHHA